MKTDLAPQLYSFRSFSWTSATVRCKEPCWVLVFLDFFFLFQVSIPFSHIRFLNLYFTKTKALYCPLLSESVLIGPDQRVSPLVLRMLLASQGTPGCQFTAGNCTTTMWAAPGQMQLEIQRRPCCSPCDGDRTVRWQTYLMSHTIQRGGRSLWAGVFREAACWLGQKA